MSSTNLEDDVPLKGKHQKYNEIVKQALANDIESLETEFKPHDDDLENLKKIDIASHKRNLTYILSVLKSGDMLCVSRALKQCPWLFTEQQYAHIINPQYIEAQLQPYMYTKAFNKFIKHIRLTLNDETRAEQFYISEPEPDEAEKWLPLCSVLFIEQNVVKHVDNLKIRMFKRLCEKSITIFKIIMDNREHRENKHFLESVTFLLHTDVDLFLDCVEKILYDYQKPKLSDKSTELIMRHSPQRVIDDFKTYVACLHVPTFARHLPKEDIKTFLYKQATEDLTPYYLSPLENFWLDHLNHFIKRLPKDEQFDFVNKIFIVKAHAEIPEEKLTPDTKEYAMKRICERVRVDQFDWYKYATFQEAFEKFTSIMSGTESRNECGMLETLLKCAENNVEHICTVLRYLIDLLKNYQKNSIYDYVNCILSNTRIHEYNDSAWKMINNFFRGLNVYNEEEQTFPCSHFVNAIIVHHIVQGTPIPSEIEKQFVFHTLESYQATMTKDQGEKIFSYLYDYLLSKLKEPTNEEEFDDEMGVLRNFFHLLIDWKKELINYPMILIRIKKVVQLKREKSWKKENLSSLYNMKNSWRRHMFEESLAMCTKQETCLNALKHQPSLLTQYNDEVSALQLQDGVNLGHFLAKLRVYYTNTIAQQWIDKYLQSLDHVLAHKAIVRGLFILLSRQSLKNIIETNAPKSPKIDWTKTDEKTLTLQRHIAKNMHIARPQPNEDAVLLYAKGDYLQFALPSLLAIFYNLSPSLTREHIQKILDAPVSLQKHGIRFTYLKFDHEEHKTIFLNCWKASKNLSIRTLIFNFTHKLLCTEKDEAIIINLWELINTFIDTFSFEEDKKIYELLFEIEKIPLIVRADYLKKSYKFLQKFLPNAKSIHVNYDRRIVTLANHSREIIEFMDEEFITELIDDYVENEFYNSEENEIGMIGVISVYLLCCKDVDTQIRKYDTTLKPILEHALKNWNGSDHDTTNLIRRHVGMLLQYLSKDLKDFALPKDMIVPTKMFSNIYNELVKYLPVPENYLLLTGWKLITELTKLIELIGGNDWHQVMTEIAPEFGNISLRYLKEDVETHFSCIYLLFFKAMKDYVMSALVGNDDLRVAIYKQMLSDKNFIQAYLAVIQFCYHDINTYGDKQFSSLKEILSSNDSVEVKFHYTNRIEQPS